MPDPSIEHYFIIALALLGGYFFFRWWRGRSVVFYVNGILVVVSVKRNRFRAFFFGNVEKIKLGVSEVLSFPKSLSLKQAEEFYEKDIDPNLLS